MTVACYRLSGRLINIRVTDLLMVFVDAILWDLVAAMEH